MDLLRRHARRSSAMTKVLRLGGCRVMEFLQYGHRRRDSIATQSLIVLALKMDELHTAIHH